MKKLDATALGVRPLALSGLADLVLLRSQTPECQGGGFKLPSTDVK